MNKVCTLNWGVDNCKYRYTTYLNSYKAAVVASKATGWGVTDEDVAAGITTVTQKLEKACFNFQRMDGLFKLKQNINPVHVLGTLLPPLTLTDTVGVTDRISSVIENDGSTGAESNGLSVDGSTDTTNSVTAEVAANDSQNESIIAPTFRASPTLVDNDQEEHLTIRESVSLKDKRNRKESDTSSTAGGYSCSKKAKVSTEAVFSETMERMEKERTQAMKAVEDKKLDIEERKLAREDTKTTLLKEFEEKKLALEERKISYMQILEDKKIEMEDRKICLEEKRLESVATKDRLAFVTQLVNNGMPAEKVMELLNQLKG